MNTTLNDLIKLYVFPRGRREFALKAVAKLAESGGHDQLAEACRQGAAHDRRTRELERELKAREALGADPRLGQLDASADRTLSALYDIPEATARALGGEMVQAARAFQSDLLPGGVHAVTSLPWAEQITELEAIMKLLRGSHRAAVERFHLQALVERLGQVTEQFAELLNANRPDPKHSAAELRARDARGQDHLLQAIALTLGLYPKATKADARARAELLAPVRDQSEQIREARSRRRPPGDIDPDSGQPQEDLA